MHHSFLYHQASPDPVVEYTDLYAGLDGAVHIAEECTRPEKTVPLALLSTVGMGFLTGFAMSVALIYVTQDLTAALAGE